MPISKTRLKNKKKIETSREFNRKETERKETKLHWAKEQEAGVCVYRENSITQEQETKVETSQEFNHHEIARERPREIVVPPPTLSEMAVDLGLWNIFRLGNWKMKKKIF